MGTMRFDLAETFNSARDLYRIIPVARDEQHDMPPVAICVGKGPFNFQAYMTPDEAEAFAGHLCSVAAKARDLNALPVA